MANSAVAPTLKWLTKGKVQTIKGGGFGEIRFQQPDGMTSHSKTMLCSEINDKSFTTEFTFTMVEIHPLWISQGFLLEKLKCGDQKTSC